MQTQAHYSRLTETSLYGYFNAFFTRSRHAHTHTHTRTYTPPDRYPACILAERYRNIYRSFESDVKIQPNKVDKKKKRKKEIQQPHKLNLLLKGKLMIID